MLVWCLERLAPQGSVLSPFIQSCKHTSRHSSCLSTSCLHATKHVLCGWDNQLNLQKWKHVAHCLPWTIACGTSERHLSLASGAHRLLCPWASEAYRVEAFLFYWSLKNSNENWKHSLYKRRAQFSVGRNIPRLVGLCCVRQVVEQARGSKPVNSIPSVVSVSVPTSRFLPWSSSVRDYNL